MIVDQSKEGRGRQRAKSAPTVLPFTQIAKAGLGDASPESDEAVVATSEIDTGKHNTAKWTAVVTVPKDSRARPGFL